MPLYGYKCTNCGAEIEVLQKMSDEPLKVCEHCKKPKLEKTLSSQTSFNLKGRGWYKSGMPR